MVLFKMMRFSNKKSSNFQGIRIGESTPNSHGKVVLDISWEGAGFLVGESAKPETEYKKNGKYTQMVI